MMPLVFALPGNERLAKALAGALGADLGAATLRRFPDGETYVRAETPVLDREVILACTLHRPDERLLPLYFLASTARELGARRVGLVAPYLAYMRQDRRFADGEGITSAYFARLLAGAADWLVTVDPHLHRRSSLAEIYRMPTAVVHAASAIAAWVRARVPQPVLVGPDSESAQWVRAVADAAGAPVVVLEKVRRGDRDVSVSIPEVDRWGSYTPVLVDDIISTARTMIETVGHLRRANLPAAVCIGVHAIFADRAYEALLAAGAGRVVTCDTIPHRSNEIELTPLLVEPVRTLATATAGSVGS
jgi:ribose-phosphate pyrophosphokinase